MRGRNDSIELFLSMSCIVSESKCVNKYVCSFRYQKRKEKKEKLYLEVQLSAHCIKKKPSGELEWYFYGLWHFSEYLKQVTFPIRSEIT